MLGQKLMGVCAAALVAAATLIPAGVHAQFLDRLANPKVAVTIKHPPGLGILVSKIAFGPGTGQGVDEFIDALTTHFVNNHVEVIERQRLQELLKEHNFSLSGFVDRQSTAEMGKIVGPAVMIFVNMQRHATERKRLQNNWSDNKGIVHTTYISQTQAFVKGSIRSVDLATGRIFAAKILEASPIVENKVEDRCCAEYPEELSVLDGAMRQVVDESVRLFLPWTSSPKLYYFDDNDCGLKNAFGRFKAGDVEGALRLSLENIESCKALPKPNPKALAHANHNVGMSYFALNQYDKAAQYLEEAQRIRPASIHTEAIAMVRMADAESREIQRVEEKVAVAAVDAAQKDAAAAAATTKETMTNKTVLDLVNGKLPSAVIIAKIKTSPCRFDTGADALIALKRGGVPDDVIVVMMGCK